MPKINHIQRVSRSRSSQLPKQARAIQQDFHFDDDQESDQVWFKPKQVIGNKYTILRAIGSGAHGQAYLAQDPDHRKVVVKQYFRSVGQYEDFLRQQNEVSLLQQTGMYIDQGSFGNYIVEKFIPGITLREYIKQRNANLQQVYEQCLQALSEFHNSTGMLHNDVHLENFVVTPQQGCSVIDFEYATKYSEESQAVKEMLKFEQNFYKEVDKYK